MRKKQDMLYLQEISQKKEGTYYDRENKKSEKSDSDSGTGES